MTKSAEILHEETAVDMLSDRNRNNFRTVLLLVIVALEDKVVIEWRFWDTAIAFLLLDLDGCKFSPKKPSFHDWINQVLTKNQYDLIHLILSFLFINIRDKERESLAASTSTKFFLHNQSTFHHNVGEKVAQVCKFFHFLHRLFPYMSHLTSMLRFQSSFPLWSSDHVMLYH